MSSLADVFVRIMGDDRPVNKTVEGVRRSLIDLDDTKVEPRITLPEKPIADIKALSKQLDTLGRKRVSLNVNATLASAEVKSLTRQLDELQSKRTTASVELQPGLDRQIAEVQRELDAIGRKEIKIPLSLERVDDKIAAVKAKLEALSDDVKVNVDVDADTRGAWAKIRALTLKEQVVRIRADVNSTSLANASRGVSNLATAIIALGPAAIPILGATTAALGAVGVGALGAAGAGSVLGASVVGVVHDMTEAKKIIDKTATTANNWATKQEMAKVALDATKKGTREYNTALKEYTDTAATAAMYQGEVTSQQREFNETFGPAATGIDSVKRAWGAFMEAAQPATVKVMGQGMEVLAKILPRLAPVANAAAVAVGGLFDRFGKFVDGPQMAKILTFLETKGPAMLTSFVNIATNVVKGVISLFAAFLPISDQVVGGFEAMTARFAAWSAQLSKSQGFQNFMAYVRANAPVVLEFVKNIFMTVVQLMTALAPYGAAVLKIINSISAGFNDLPIPVVQGLLATIGAVVVALKLWQLGFFAVTAAQRIATVATVAFRVAMLAVNVALRLNPIGLIVTALTALVAGLIYAYKHSETFRDVVNGVWAAIKTTALAVVNWFANEVPRQFGVIVDKVKSVWGSITGFFQGVWNAISTGVTTGWRAITGAISTAWNAIGSFFTSAAKTITAPVFAAWEAIRGGVSTAFAAIGNVIKIALGLWVSIIKIEIAAIGALFLLGWQAMKAVVTTIFTAIKLVISAAWAAIKPIFTTAMAALSKAWTAFWNANKLVATTVFNAIKAVITTVWNAIKSVFTTVMNAVKAIFSAWWNNLKANASTVFNAIKNTVITPVWNAIKSIFATVSAAIRSAFSAWWNNLKANATTVFNAIRTVITTVWTAIRNLFTTVMAAIRAAFSTWWTNLRNNATTMFNAIRTVLTSVWEAIKRLWEAAHSWIRGKWDSFWGTIKRVGSDAITAVKTKIDSVFNQIRTATTNFVKNIASGFDKIKSAFSAPWDWVKSHVFDKIASAYNVVARLVGAKTINLADGGPVASRTTVDGRAGGVPLADGGPVKRAVGGVIKGRGGPRADNIMGIDRKNKIQTAWVSAKEYVVNAKSYAANKGAVEAINAAHGPLKRSQAARADGGPVPGLFLGGGVQPVPGHGNQHSGYGWARWAGDFPVGTGTAVHAYKAGQVSAVRSLTTSYGKHVRINHGSEQTLYAHLQNFAVKVGQQVAANQVIAHSDSTGNSTGPHVHFELAGGSGKLDTSTSNSSSLLSFIKPRAMFTKVAKGILNTVGKGISALGGGLGDTPVAEMIGKIPGKLVDLLASKLPESFGSSSGSTINAPKGAGSRLKNAATIAGVGSGGGRRAQTIGLITALVESNLNNVGYGDRDSVGLFQQRAPWGSRAARMDPKTSAGMFFNGGRGGQRGLYDIPGWRSKSLGAAAQAVQVSAFPGRYQQRVGEAEGLLKQLGLANGGVVKGGRGGVTARVGEGRFDELVTPLPRGWKAGKDDDNVARLVALLESGALGGNTVTMTAYNPLPEPTSVSTNKQLQRAAGLGMV